MSYVHVTFENARLFSDIRSKYKVHDYRNNQDIQFTGRTFRSPITLYQVSNMIHVLFGERPVPTLRPSSYPKIDKYFDKAKESYIKIDNYYGGTDKNGDDILITETMSTIKGIYNSNSSNIKSNWDMMGRYFGELIPELHIWLSKLINSSSDKLSCDDLNEKLVGKLKNPIAKCMRMMDTDTRIEWMTKNLSASKPIAEDTISERFDLIVYKIEHGVFEMKMSSFKELLLLCDDPIIILFREFIEWLSMNKKSSFIYWIIGNPALNSHTTSNTSKCILDTSKESIIHGIEETMRLSGEIMIPIDRTDYDILSKQSTGCVSILDGGIVTIRGFVDDFINENFKKVGDISLEKMF